MKNGGFAGVTLAVFRKDTSSELRTRYALNALFLFTVTTLSIILFSFQSATVPLQVHAGLLWVLIFFAAMSGLSRAFITEEDRGTILLLKLSTISTPVFYGKLLFNVLLLLALTTVLTVLYALVVPGFAVQGIGTLCTSLFLGSVGLASASTIIGALIAKANARGTLYPVLSFPIVLPLLLTVIRATAISMEDPAWGAASDEYRVLLSYIVAINAASYLVFEFIWKD
jgi:heme exporter protein B